MPFVLPDQTIGNLLRIVFAHRQNLSENGEFHKGLFRSNHSIDGDHIFKDIQDLRKINGFSYDIADLETKFNKWSYVGLTEDEKDAKQKLGVCRAGIFSGVGVVARQEKIVKKIEQLVAEFQKKIDLVLSEFEIKRLQDCSKSYNRLIDKVTSSSQQRKNAESFLIEYINLYAKRQLDGQLRLPIPINFCQPIKDLVTSKSFIDRYNNLGPIIKSNGHDTNMLHHSLAYMHFVTKELKILSVNLESETSGYQTKWTTSNFSSLPKLNWVIEVDATATQSKIIQTPISAPRYDFVLNKAGEYDVMWKDKVGKWTTRSKTKDDDVVVLCKHIFSNHLSTRADGLVGDVRLSKISINRLGQIDSKGDRDAKSLKGLFDRMIKQLSSIFPAHEEDIKKTILWEKQSIKICLN